MTEQQTYRIELWQRSLYDQFAGTIPAEIRTYVILMMIIKGLQAKKKAGEVIQPFEELLLSSWEQD